MSCKQTDMPVEPDKKSPTIRIIEGSVAILASVAMTYALQWIGFFPDVSIMF